ncbi:putative cyclin dependent kinase inhibitor Pho81 [Aspergillus brunneoviolaceus CBS 621.78]|uniref:Ankyrin repeat protein nuc-2 n=1 Tax=Aspergillus brunneoviolaceus CBS 621.78 TaxID=1450534 RepID=A0ACD1FWY1_9EURO|nr:ankyrin repeat protein nuc-2 [Aspergillus brunneoviolaceus CBS 621.78]RAH41483.1 ankyrin repeat protein nuc-2 [Aspergillus brunneoviolaceus CBS 621.78]
MPFPSPRALPCADPDDAGKRKFGKQIQRRQLDLPEYAASFVNYKALKKLIKQLSATPTIPAQSVAGAAQDVPEAQAALRANKEVFFFRLEREIEKVNAFYLQKEAEFSLRLKTLVDKKRVIQSRAVTNSKAPANYVSLFEGFQQFDGDLNKLQQFVEINETAMSKILKKWDKTSKSRMKELYLHRAVEVQPCFNRDVLRDLSDRATTARLELEAWAEGENIHFDTIRPVDRSAASQSFGPDEEDLDLQILQSASSGNLQALREWTAKLQSSPDASIRATRTFLAAINEFSDEVLAVLLKSGLVDINAEDDINERNCLHEAAISGREFVLKAGLTAGVDISRCDVYGRLPLHYACMHGRVEMVRELLKAGPHTIDVMDHDNFTPLIHSIVKDQLACAEQLLCNNARIDPNTESDHIPLNLACQYGSIPIVQMLLERDARLLPDAEGLYPQHMVARASQSPQLLLLLKQHGANMDQRDKLYQWTPLFHAASEGCVDCLRTLLELGVDAGAVDEKCLAAMYYAAWEGHLECMLLLWSHSITLQSPQKPLGFLNGVKLQDSGHDYASGLNDLTDADNMDMADGIPDLSLPPPIIPLRRYGHNFLDKKVFIQILFDPGSTGSILFDQAGRHPAARLTISSKLSDLIPRTIMLPIQEDSRMISFHVDNLDTFAVDFEIFPTFGSKVIAKTVALPNMFKAESSSTGTCSLPLFDPRLRSIGQLRFNFQVIKPYHGDPLEITHFATYWKATSAIDHEHNGLVTGSSLSGDHIQLFVQLTRDRVPVLYPQFAIEYHGIEIPICQLTYAQFRAIGVECGVDHLEMLRFLRVSALNDLAQAHRQLASSFLSLRDVFHHLPLSVSVNLSVLYPSAMEERASHMASLPDVNTFADAILTEVFDHARIARDQSPDIMRSVVFTSYNPNICIALNWKQPNYPVLLCNDLGQIRDLARDVNALPDVNSSGRASMSIKDSARIAQSNNFMGLICRSSLLNVVPALVDTIKELGLVLVADTSDDANQPDRMDVLQTTDPVGVADWAYRMPDGVNGVMKANGILRFNDTIDM